MPSKVTTERKTQQAEQFEKGGGVTYVASPTAVISTRRIAVPLSSDNILQWRTVAFAARRLEIVRLFPWRRQTFASGGVLCDLMGPWRILGNHTNYPACSSACSSGSANCMTLAIAHRVSTLEFGQRCPHAAAIVPLAAPALIDGNYDRT
jgi:hypothetical protein